MLPNNLKKMIICDPVCVQELGHSLIAIKRYNSYLKSKGLETDIFISRLLKDKINLDLPKEVNFYYSHYYALVLPNNNTNKDEMSKKILDSSIQNKDEITKEIALIELNEIFDSIKEPSNTGIFFPSIDYYSLNALVSILEKNHSKNLPKLFIRWIGVMENSYININNLSPLLLCRRLGNLNKLNENLEMSFSAESKPYARNLSVELNQNVVSTPTFIQEDKKEIPELDSKFRISFPGSARVDKGLLRIDNILHLLKNKFNLIEYEAYLQLPNSSELNAHYLEIRELLKNSNVRCYPTSVSQDTLRKYIAFSNILVTPYDSRTYLYRSSAIMAEAACYGRQVVSSSDCGFSEELEDLSIGKCGSSDEEIARIIHEYYTLGRDQMNLLVEKARTAYLNYLDSSYQEFFGFVL